MIQAILPLISPVIEKIIGYIPNPAEKEKVKQDIEREMVNAVIEAGRLQAQINVEEAKHKSVFVAGWRPAIGWVCGIGLLWQFFLFPMANWIAIMWYPSVTLPVLQTTGLFELVLAMLGMGGLRTYEKLKGINSK